MVRRRRGRSRPGFLQYHSLSIVALGVLMLWFFLYSASDPKSHAGSFFGNALADWMGVVITILATKWFFEKDSEESRRPRQTHPLGTVRETIHEHSLTIFLIVTGFGWVLLFSRVDPDTKWGTVVSNIVSEWSQQIGLIIMTKRLIERGSKESSR